MAQRHRLIYYELPDRRFQSRTYDGLTRLATSRTLKRVHTVQSQSPPRLVHIPSTLRLSTYISPQHHLLTTNLLFLIVTYLTTYLHPYQPAWQSTFHMPTYRHALNNSTNLPFHASTQLPVYLPTYPPSNLSTPPHYHAMI